MVKIVLGKPHPNNNGANMNMQAGNGNRQIPAMPDMDVKQDVNGLSRRLKVLEERYTTTRGKIQVLEQNMLQKNKSFYTDIKSINLELTDIKKEIGEIKDKIVMVIKEIQGFAKKENLEVLRKYIDLWNPVQFVTKESVEDIVKEVIDKIRSEQ